MRFSAYRVFFTWDFEEEEQWLNEMASKGMNLQGVGFCKYVFEEGTPGEYQYHIEWLKNRPSHPESISYIRFLEEAGVEHIGSFKSWVYLRKKRSDGTFDLYSDLDTRIDHFRRSVRLSLVLLPILLAYMGFLIYFSIVRKGFLLSAIPYLAILALLLGCIGFGLVKSYRTYRRLKKERIMRE